MSDDGAVRAPLGESESQRLEFKAAAALERPERIAREVVAMLNAEGGEVWVGVREEGGVALEIEPIAEANREKERLIDFLVDTLSPSPQSEEVRVEVVALPEATAGGLLRVKAEPQKGRGPYALVRGGRWEFCTRIGARLRPMERGELARLFAAAADEGTGIRRAEEQIHKEKEERQAAGEPVMWLRVLPVPALDLDLQDPLFEELASNPRRSGNRRTGASFAESTSRTRLATGRITWAVEEMVFPDRAPRKYAQAAFEQDGGAEFEAPLEALRLKDLDLSPLALFEYPVSGLRLARTVYEGRLSEGSSIVADLALFAVGDRKLKPGSPRDPLFPPKRARPLTEGEDAVCERPLVFNASELLDEPDRCGFRLLRRIYQAFGLREDDMPREFDRRSGRLVLPE